MRRPKWTLQMAGFGAVGCALALAGSFLIPDRYTSTATLRFSQPLVPVRISGEVSGMPTVDRFQQMEHEILSRESLSQIIQKPSLDLYSKQRAHAPIEDIVEKMSSQDLSIRLVSPEFGIESAFAISFTYPDRYKAARVVREVVSRFENQYLRAMLSRAMELKDGDDVRKALDHKLGENLEILDPANVPETPSGPDRLTFTAAGVLFGLLAGATNMRLRQHLGPAVQPA